MSLIEPLSFENMLCEKYIFDDLRTDSKNAIARLKAVYYHPNVDLRTARRHLNKLVSELSLANMLLPLLDVIIQNRENYKCQELIDIYNKIKKSRSLETEYMVEWWNLLYDEYNLIKLL